MSDLESSSSSSSDAEELDRCREAAMPAWGLEQRPRGPEEPRAGRGLCSGSLAEGRRIFPCGLRMDGEEGVLGMTSFREEAPGPGWGSESKRGQVQQGGLFHYPLQRYQVT